YYPFLRHIARSIDILTSRNIRSFGSIPDPFDPIPELMARNPSFDTLTRKKVDSEVCHNATEADLPIVKGRRYKAMDSRVMSLATPWYRKSRTFVESLIPCSYRGRALVVKGVEVMENVEANSKYQDKAEG
ncbi:hypothetical protein B296_00041134, partial [Ensete ventricosum]